MALSIPQYKTWRTAKNLACNFQYTEAIALYKSIETDMRNLQEWRSDKTERDNLFHQAMFFGDYCGALADSGFYEEAKEKGDFALKCIEQGNISSLEYIYYNIGNIYLFQHEYEQSCKWFELALKGATYFYTSVNNYLVNYGISLYYLREFDRAKEKFQLAISSSKGTKYNKTFEPFFYMSKISKLENEEKESQKYEKMYLTRLKKYSQIELEWAISTMKDKKEILEDYTKK